MIAYVAIFFGGMDSVDQSHSVVDMPWIRHGQLVYDILINCTFFKSYDIIQTRQSEGPLYEIHA